MPLLPVPGTGKGEDPLAALVLPHWSQAQRVLGELQRLAPGPPLGRIRRAFRKACRKLGVRPRGSQSEVAHAQRLVGDRRELTMEPAPLGGACMRLHGCGQERVRRAHAVAVDHHHAGVDGVVQRVRLRDRRNLGDA